MEPQIIKLEHMEFLSHHQHVMRDYYGFYTIKLTDEEDWSQRRVYRTVIGGFANHFVAAEPDALYIYKTFPRNRVDMLHDLVYNAGMTCLQAFEYISL